MKVVTNTIALPFLLLDDHFLLCVCAVRLFFHALKLDVGWIIATIATRFVQIVGHSGYLSFVTGAVYH